MGGENKLVGAVVRYDFPLVGIAAIGVAFPIACLVGIHGSIRHMINKGGLGGYWGLIIFTLPVALTLFVVISMLIGLFRMFIVLFKIPKALKYGEV